MSEQSESSGTIRLGDLEVQRLGYGAMRLPGKDVWGEPDDPAAARLKELQKATTGGGEIAEGTNAEGRSVIAAMAPIPGPDWLAFVEQPVSEAFGPISSSLSSPTGRRSISRSCGRGSSMPPSTQVMRSRFTP